jgi:transposase
MNQAPDTATRAQASDGSNNVMMNAHDDGADAGTPGRGSEYPGPLAGRRRRFTSEEKRRFLFEASQSNESMSSIGRRYGLSVSLLFRWRRQLDGSARPNPRLTEEGARAEARELRDKVRELERLLGRKTLEAELLKQELTKLGHNPAVALNALDAQQTR